MSESAQNSNAGFTTVQAYTLAVITLVIGIAVGYFARGSASVAAPAESAQAAAPSAMGSAPMGAAQLPGIGSPQQQQAPSPEMLAKAAEPLLAQLKTNPKDAATLIKLGNLYYDGQSYPEAIQYYQKALEIEPDNPDVRTDLGTPYWYTGDADKAIANFENRARVWRIRHSLTCACKFPQRMSDTSRASLARPTFASMYPRVLLS